MNTLIQRNVVLLPSPEMSHKAISWSSLVKNLGAHEFVLGSQENLTHLSAYQAAYPQEQEETLFAAVGEIAQQVQPFTVTMNGFGVFWGTFVFWDAIKSAALTGLHQALLKVLNPLRQNQLLSIHEQILGDANVPEPLRMSIKMWGNPLCDTQERPHITIIRMQEPSGAEQAEDYLRKLGSTNFRFDVRSLYIADVGPHGTCPRILKEFPLSSRSTT